MKIPPIPSWMVENYCERWMKPPDISIIKTALAAKYWSRRLQLYPSIAFLMLTTIYLAWLIFHDERFPARATVNVLQMAMANGLYIWLSCIAMSIILHTEFTISDNLYGISKMLRRYARFCDTFPDCEAVQYRSERSTQVLVDLLLRRRVLDIARFDRDKRKISAQAFGRSLIAMARSYDSSLESARFFMDTPDFAPYEEWHKSEEVLRELAMAAKH